MEFVIRNVHALNDCGKRLIFTCKYFPCEYSIIEFHVVSFPLHYLKTVRSRERYETVVTYMRVTYNRHPKAAALRKTAGTDCKSFLNRFGGQPTNTGETSTNREDTRNYPKRPLAHTWTKYPPHGRLTELRRKEAEAGGAWSCSLNGETKLRFAYKCDRDALDRRRPNKTV